MKQGFHRLSAISSVPVDIARAAIIALSGALGFFDHPAGPDGIVNRLAASLFLVAAGFKPPAGEEGQKTPDPFHIQSQIANNVLYNPDTLDVGPRQQASTGFRSMINQ